MSYETIVRDLKHPDGWVRLKAVEALSYSNDEQCKSLMHVLNDDSYVIRWQVAEVCETSDGDLRSELIRALNDANWWDKLRIPWALAMVGDASGVERLVSLLDREDKVTSLAIIFLLGKIGDRRAIKKLGYLAATSTDTIITKEIQRSITLIINHK